MSVKPSSSLSPSTSLVDRLLGIVFADWWIDVILMLFIVGCMVYEHQ